MVSEALVGPPTLAQPQRLGGVEEPELVCAAEALPRGCLLFGGFDAIGRAAKGERGQVLVGPAGEMPDRRIGAGDSRWREALGRGLASL
jgi:hypothetical protein